MYLYNFYSISCSHKCNFSQALHIKSITPCDLVQNTKLCFINSWIILNLLTGNLSNKERVCVYFIMIRSIIDFQFGIFFIISIYLCYMVFQIFQSSSEFSLSVIPDFVSMIIHLKLISSKGILSGTKPGIILSKNLNPAWLPAEGWNVRNM